MIYYELSDLYEENIKKLELEKVLISFDYIKFYAFILHNRTENIKPHYHVLIQVDLNNKKAKNRIEKDFKKLNPFVKNVRNVKAYARYLQHLDYLDKEKYEDIEILTNNVNQFNDLKHIDIKKSKIEDLLNCFYDYLIRTGCVLSTAETFEWFSKKGQSNYYICHQKSINDFMFNLFNSDCWLNEIERRLNLKNDNINNTFDYISFDFDKTEN